MLFSQINTLERLSKGSKLTRLLAHPVKYLIAIGIKWFYYPLFKSGSLQRARTFWNEPFWVHLPAGNDIFITGGKSDDSELRLTKYLTQNLSEGDCFIDVGSHYGFYTRLALHCLGNSGKVVAIEPSERSFAVLNKNAMSFKNVLLFNCLAGWETGVASFYEFPLKYSEYNTIHPEQFEHSTWFKQAHIIKRQLQVITLDDLSRQHGLTPTFIKIDAEGAEFSVLKGASDIISHKKATIVMEYLSQKRGNEAHKQACDLLKQYQYLPYFIDNSGSLEPCHDLDNYLEEKHVDSDNIVFQFRA